MPRTQHESAIELLDGDTLRRLAKNGRAANRVERMFAERLERLLLEHAVKQAEALAEGRKPSAPEGIEQLLMAHARAAMRAGLERVDDGTELKRTSTTQLAAPPKGRVPRTLDALRAWWRKFREGKRATPRVASLTERLKAEYLRNLQRTYEELSDDFREGREVTQDAVRARMRKIIGGSLARARTVVATETTRYYNTVRREAYDASDDVTHYLFISIRDYRTTKWCKDRSGLVYRKGSDLLDREQPACHWNCRSEIVPLTPLNPSHRALIDSAERRRENVACTPLPKGWNK